MYSNPRVLTYENAPINSGIKSVYPELSQYIITDVMCVLVLCIHITQGDEKHYIPRDIYINITDVMCVLVLCIHITQGMRSVIFLEIYIL